MLRLPRLAGTVTPGGAPAPGGVTSKSNIHNATDASAARGSGSGALANPTGGAAFKIAAG
jgi:hypothetical protein